MRNLDISLVGCHMSAGIKIAIYMQEMLSWWYLWMIDECLLNLESNSQKLQLRICIIWHHGLWMWMIRVSGYEYKITERSNVDVPKLQSLRSNIGSHGSDYCHTTCRWVSGETSVELHLPFSGRLWNGSLLIQTSVLSENCLDCVLGWAMQI